MTKMLPLPSTKMSLGASTALGPPKKVFHCTSGAEVGVAVAIDVRVGVGVLVGVFVATGAEVEVAVEVEVKVGVEVGPEVYWITSLGLWEAFDASEVL